MTFFGFAANYAVNYAVVFAAVSAEDPISGMSSRMRIILVENVNHVIVEQFYRLRLGLLWTLQLTVTVQPLISRH